MKSLNVFEFETITVNANGEIAHRERKQAHYQTEDLGKGIILEMVHIPGGTFIMGSPETEEGRYKNESPQHQVTIKPFYMSKYPITQAQWQAIMENNPSYFKGENRPVESISWHDAVAFCKRLSEMTDKSYSLPSEAQWEYACRAGTTTPFYFGENITTDLVNYQYYRGETTEVGSFPPNAFGLYDMHGNVWEWCADPWHKNYEGAPSDGSVWKDGRYSNRFSLRGGSWFIVIKWRMRSANRDDSTPDHGIDMGLRIARL